MTTIDITVQGDRLEFIYNDAVASLLDEGTATVKRVSHVEPSLVDGRHGWTADMSPVQGPVLGPYETRAEALDAEHEWLQAERGL
jgi:hypothetical protein